MKVAKHGNVGFTKIYTSDNANPYKLAPHKKPYIIFEAPFKNEDDVDYQESIGNLLNLGLFDIQNNKLILTITSTNKVIRAIDFFSNLGEYQTEKNKDLFSSLDQYKEKCTLNLRAKSADIPPKSKLFSKYEKKHDTVNKSYNKTYHIIKKSLPNPKEYIHKENLTGRKISEIEVFNAYCYRLLLGNRHPRVIDIRNDQGERKGVASELIPGFESVRDFYIKHGQLTAEKLLKSEFIKVLVAAYVEEETDLHTLNYGFDKSGFCVKIDDDRSTWPLTAKYAGIDPSKGDKSGDYTTPPISDFLTTKRDILSFPKLQDANPYHWFDRQGSEDMFNKHILADLMPVKKFIDDKFYIFLKRILISDEVYKAISIATLGSHKARTLFANHKIKKTLELKKTLLNMREFQQYILENQNVIEKIKEEWSEYNKDFDKAKDYYLKINLVQIESDFNLLYKHIHSQVVHPAENVLVKMGRCFSRNNR